MSQLSRSVRARRLILPVLAAVTVIGPWRGAPTRAFAGGAAGANAKPKAVEVERLADDAVRVAVAHLLKEQDDAAKDPKIGLRGKSDYFQQNKSPDLTPLAIASALNRSLGRDVSSDSYIKWQLCSGLKDLNLDAKQDAKVVSLLTAAYRGAPSPLSRPGLSPSEKRAMDARVNTLKAADLPALNKQFDAEVERWSKANVPILEYRDALYAKLSPLPDTLALSFEDGCLRASCGVDCPAHMKAVMAQVQAWAVTATPNQVAGLAEQIKRIAREMGATPAAGADAAGRGNSILVAANKSNGASPQPPKRPSFPPFFYTKADEDKNSHHCFWHEGQADFVKPDEMLDRYNALMDVVKNSEGGGLKFKGSSKS